MLYLIRHAHAVDDEDDAVRELSAEGRAQARRLAAFLRDSGEMRPAEFWHSPLVRASQTASLLAESLGLRVPLRKVDGLKSEDDPRVITPRLQSPLSLALVGHEPHLSALASLLVTGAAFPPVFFMGKCAILALERTKGGNTGCWAVRWYVAPELLV
jgi:phosphohistidine phosphatase